jgi:adenine-specific DNA-methyltransferase
MPGPRKRIEQYEHATKKRKNNPPVGLVTPQTDPEEGKKQYAYDPHLDPRLEWAGKAEHTSFEVDTVSLHVHERIDPRTIIEAVRRRDGDRPAEGEPTAPVQMGLFEQPAENPPLRDAIAFYKHEHNWSNRLIAGDSLLVMNSLIEKEGMAGQVQMVYIDPPYGIRYGSNFQPFTNKRDVKDGKDEDLTQEPETIKAFRDTWELGIHSYLTYLRDRLLLARELLSESGSIFVQISDENVHLVRNLMDEVFGARNFVSLIPVVKTSGLGASGLARLADFLLWYAHTSELLKYRQLYIGRDLGDEGSEQYSWVELPDKSRRRMSVDERRDPSLLPDKSRAFRLDNLTSGAFRENTTIPYEFRGRVFHPGTNKCWKTTKDGLDVLASKNRIEIIGNTLAYVRYISDFPLRPLKALWADTGTGGFGDEKFYVVQTTTKIIQRCLLMVTDPGDLVFDPTCGSGTTAYVAEQWGRRWITCDTSRVAITLAKQRLMTALFDYYELARHDEGIASGFQYKTVPHVTLKSIANNEPPAQETLYDRPEVDNSRARVTGPFTVEAVPAPAVKPLSEIEAEPIPADASIARSGPTSRQAEWRDELLKTGIRGKAGQMIEFTRVEPLAGTRHLRADAETKEDRPQRAVISFGPEHAPLEQRQVARALEEAYQLVPVPKIVIFAAFQFDPEAAKDIDETEWPGVTLLKAQMNTDLLTDDLKKKRSGNQSFWLIGQPDVELRQINKGEHKGRYEVEIHGFDYYNTKTGGIESGDTTKIAMWMLDTDYDGRSLLPRQVFFPMAGEKAGWARLAKNLKAEIDEDLIEAYRGTVSLLFKAGGNGRVAIKIIDDRGIESLKIISMEN